MDNYTVIPPSDIPDEQLQALLESFVLREGTDYGDSELSLAEKLRTLTASVKKGETLVVFDVTSESFNILNKNDYRQVMHD